MNVFAGIVRWTARLVAIGLIIFVSLFALDVFGQGNWFIALLIHLIPSYVLVVITVIAWKNEVLGGAAFSALAVIFIVTTRFEATIIYIPTLAVGLLFLLSGWLRRRISMK